MSAHELKVADEETALHQVAHAADPSLKLGPLPPPNPDVAGSSVHKDKNFTVKISSSPGYLAHVHLDATFDVPPEALFSIFTYPDNSALFRDVKRVGERKVISAKPGLRVVEVQQIGELRALWVTRQYRTWLRVTEDSRDESCLHIQFDLLKSDVLAKFNGHWTITPVKDVAGKVVGCRGILEQDVLPAGMPAFVQRMPVLGGLLRGISTRSIKRIMEDINKAMPKISAGLAKGKPIQHILNDLCGTCAPEEGYTNGNVKSFQIEDVGDDEDGEDGEAGEGEGQQASAKAVDAPACLSVLLEVHEDESVKLHVIAKESLQA